MTTAELTHVSERITETQALIARLESELAEARKVEAQSRETRRGHALAAAKGDAKAVRALAEASEAAARAMLQAEDTELALDGARQELAQLEAEAEEERLAGVREKALELARERLKLGPELERLLAELDGAFQRWRALGQELAGLRYQHPALPLPALCEDPRPFVRAVSDALRVVLRKAPEWLHPSDKRPIAEGDPAAHLLREAGEVPPLPPEPPSLAETTLAEMNAEAEKQDPRPKRRRADEIAVGAQPAHPVNVPGAAERALQGRRLVPGVRLAGGGGVTERVRPDSAAA